MQVVREHREDLIGRVRLLAGTVTGLLVLIASGFWFVQIAQGDYYRELAENNRLRKLPIIAPRGLIFDRRGRLLVENLPSYNLMIDRSRSPRRRGRPKPTPSPEISCSICRPRRSGRSLFRRSARLARALYSGQSSLKK